MGWCSSRRDIRHPAEVRSQSQSQESCRHAEVLARLDWLAASTVVPRCPFPCHPLMNCLIGLGSVRVSVRVACRVVSKWTVLSGLEKLVLLSETLRNSVSDFFC